MMKSLENAKNRFSGIFPAFSADKNFFSGIRLRHILGIAILHLCAKNQQKLMSQSREKLVTDGRTKVNWLIYTPAIQLSVIFEKNWLDNWCHVAGRYFPVLTSYKIDIIKMLIFTM